MGAGLIELAACWITPARTVVDVGPGIRPQAFIEAERHLCIEPHHEYVAWLGSHGYEVMQATAQWALPRIEPVDAIFLLDVIEHMDKADGREVLRVACEKARQVVVFTPLGFLHQDYQPGERDAWGMDGAHWQTHRSGWLPDEFPGWTILVDAAFHRRKGSGAFFAIWDRP